MVALPTEISVARVDSFDKSDFVLLHLQQKRYLLRSSCLVVKQLSWSVAFHKTTLTIVASPTRPSSHAFFAISA